MTTPLGLLGRRQASGIPTSGDKEAVRTLFKPRQDHLGADALWQCRVRLDGLGGELIEQGEHVFQGMKKLSLLLHFRQHDEGKVEQPTSVFLQEKTLWGEVGRARQIAFLTDQVRAAALGFQGEVDHLTAVDIVAEYRHKMKSR